MTAGLIITPAYISSCSEQHVQEVRELKFDSKEIIRIEDISACVNLTKLSLRNNRLTSSGLSGLSHCAALTTLDLSQNLLDSFSGIEKLHKLTALNVSDNKLSYLGTQLTLLKNLKALVAKSNEIAKIENLGKCTALNTLALSKNKITEISNLGALHDLTKLALAHNAIRVIPDLSANAKLRELRLSHCRITSVPEAIRHNPSLEIVDIGSNLITKFTDVVNLAALSNLHQLTLHGNPLCSDADYDARTKTLFPTLRVLDTVRFDQRFVQNKRKRQALLSRKQKLPRTADCNPPTILATKDGVKDQMEAPASDSCPMSPQAQAEPKAHEASQSSTKASVANSSSDPSSASLNQHSDAPNSAPTRKKAVSASHKSVKADSTPQPSFPASAQLANSCASVTEKKRKMTPANRQKVLAVLEDEDQGKREHDMLLGVGSWN